MRLRDQTIGALNLFQAGIEPFSAHKVNVARVLADMAAIGIINHWSIRQEEVLAQQLQSALNTRVIIEQAKGVVAERQRVTMGAAFDYLRATARASQRPIAEVAMDTVNGRDTTEAPPASRAATNAPRPTPAPRKPAATTGGATAVPDLTRPTDSDLIAVVATDVAGLAGDDMGREQSGTAAVLVAPHELQVDPPPQSLDHVATADAIIGSVYKVNPTDALDILNEASRDLEGSQVDVAVQLVTDGRLPEEAIHRARHERRRNHTAKESDQDHLRTPENK